MLDLTRINQQLIDEFGIDSDTGRPMFRVIYCDNEKELRKALYRDVTTDGFLIREVFEIREVPKYPWIENKYVLENLVVLSPQDQEISVVSKLSYEPIWIFEDKDQNPLPPRYDACKFVIDTINAVKGKGNLSKYKDSTERLLEEQETRRAKLYEELFGDDTRISDNFGIAVPESYEKEN